MGINTNAFGARVAAAGVTLTQGVAIVQEVIGLIQLAEQASAELNGSQKFKAVMAGVDTLLQQMNLGNVEAEIKAVLGPMVSLLVNIFNFLKLWLPAPTAQTLS